MPHINAFVPVNCRACLVRKLSEAEGTSVLGQEYFKFVILLGFGSGKVRGGLGDFLRGLGGVVKVGLVGRGWAGGRW